MQTRSFDSFFFLWSEQDHIWGHTEKISQNLEVEHNKNKDILKMKRQTYTRNHWREKKLNSSSKEMLLNIC